MTVASTFHSIPDSGRHTDITLASNFHSTPDSGRHTNMTLASISTSFPILDATPTWQWRPLPLPPRFWTPHRHNTGVHFHSIPDSGRHTNMAVASDSASTPILDATSTWQWRPFPLHPRFWTPHRHNTGVHFHSIPDSGRHTDMTVASTFHSIPDSGRHANMAVASTFHSTPDSGRHTDIILASISTPSPILDATPTWQWRPLPLHSRFWTPHRHNTGVHFHSIPDSGRHANLAVASISTPSPILDATQTWRWRPFPLPPRFWTPRKHGSGVQFRFIPDSGRHTNQTMVQVTSISCKIDSTLLVYLVKPLL